MKCFNHPQADAVASCKYCFKGVCPECAKDTGVGMACSALCESQVKATQALIERNKRVVAFAPKTHLRSAILLTLMALVFLVFGFVTPSVFMIVFGVVMLCGAAFAVINGRKMAKISALERT